MEMRANKEDMVTTDSLLTKAMITDLFMGSCSLLVNFIRLEAFVTESKEG